MPLSEDALPIGVRTASMTTACLILSLRSQIRSDDAVYFVGVAAAGKVRRGQNFFPVLAMSTSIGLGSNRLPNKVYFEARSTSGPAPTASHQRRIPPRNGGNPT